MFIHEEKREEVQKENKVNILMYGFKKKAMSYIKLTLQSKFVRIKTFGYR